MHRRSDTALLRIVTAALTFLCGAVSHADDLPSLPLPACTEPGLPAYDNAVCEGARVTLKLAPQGLVGPSAADIHLEISTRSVDFRLDADRGGEPQFVTFTLTLPGPGSEPQPDGTIYYWQLHNLWPERMSDGGSTPGGINCLKDGESGFRSSCDGSQVPNGSPNYKAVLYRVGDCPLGTPTCTYRVVWGPYRQGSRVRKAAIYRVGFDYTLNIIGLKDGNPVFPSCGTDLATTNCTAGGGAAYTAFRTDPPPPLIPIAEATRLGRKKFKFDASASGPDAVAWEWTLRFPDAVYHEAAIVHDFALDDPPITSDHANVKIDDRWERIAFTNVRYTFGPPEGGVEGPLQIVSFVLAGIDENGVVTLTALVKNVGGEQIKDVFLLNEVEHEGEIEITPDGVTLEPGESTTFTVTFAYDTRYDMVTAKARAYGNVPSGPVKSPEARRDIRYDPGSPPVATTVSAATAPGDTTLPVTSNQGFTVGSYAAINPDGDTAEVRRIAALGSLIFSAPLAYPHDVGEIVTLVPPPLGDTAAPTITVTSPPPGGAACQGAPLTATFSCDDGDGVGVEECGGDITSGDSLDTTTSGTHTLVLRAWDASGNTATKTIGYSVGFCSSTLDAFRCYQAKPAPGTKFAPLPGVRFTHGFADLVVDLKKPQLLCTPVATTMNAPLDPATALEAYAIGIRKQQPKPAPRSGLSFTTQLGTFAVDVKKPTQLALPTAEDGTAPPTVTPNDLDRFSCYPAKLAKGQAKLAKGLELSVAGPFSDPPRQVTVKKLARLCVPSGADGAGAKHSEHLLCFQVAPAKGRCTAVAPRNAGGGCKKEADCGGDKRTAFCAAQTKFTKLPGRHVANDLDTGILDLGKEDVVCLPALPTP